MSPHKPQARICECGTWFVTTEQYGTETRCSDCYEARLQAFFATFAQLDVDAQSTVLNRALEVAASLGITDDDIAQQIGEDATTDEDRIDTVAASLLAELDI